MNQTIDLNGRWEGACISVDGKEEFSFFGAVPGCVHTDLMGQKIDTDIYYRDHADACQWIEDRDWKYTRIFTLDTIPSHAELVFEGLDVYTDLYLNGTKFGSTDNMFVTHRFDVAALLQTGENTLTVYFHAPIRMVEGLEKRSGAFTTERMHTRRIQCTYGWDWVARFVTCGIYRDVYLDCNDAFAVKNAYIYTDNIIGTTAQIVVEAEFIRYEAGAMVAMEILDPDHQVIYHHDWYRKEAELKTHITIPNAKLWYPTGYGEQPLYTLKLGEQTYPFGIRMVTVIEEPDAVGSEYYETCLRIKDTVSGKIYDQNTEFSGFLLTVNGLPIMCKGANWVPSEPFPSAEDNTKMTTILSLAKEAGLNMLRVWGGGIFERQHFYNECDRLGILVTQDFLMACGHYPEEKPAFIAQLRRETEEAAYALRNHPCLVWWSGDNENAIRGADDMEDYQGRTAIHEGIMPVLNRLDPRRRFMLSSPCGGKVYASKTVGTTHNTQYLGESILPYIAESDMVDYKEHFAQYLARFIAEEPTMGAICKPSLQRFMTEQDIYDTTDMWMYHTKSNPGLPTPLFETLMTFTEKVLGRCKDGADRFFKLKYVQYEWIRISMENIRRNRGFCNGIVYWMWDDCWPAATGWSFVDYYGLPKASYYSFKRCAAELLTSIEKTDSYEISVCNDGLAPKAVTLLLSYLLDGTIYPMRSIEVIAEAAASAVVYRLPLSELPQGAVLFCDAKAGEETDRSFFLHGALPICPTDAVQVVAQTADHITVKADRYVHAVELEGEYIFEDNYFSLLPGESRTIMFRKADTALTEGLEVSGYTLEL